VRIETARVTVKEGKPVEGSKILRAVTTYDFEGKRVDEIAHPVDASTPVGKEQYRYDDNGNLIEMVLRGDNGSILSKETYKYEFDDLGNWKKMTTSLAVYENGTLGFEPVEVTYRTITYYYNQAVDKLGKSTPVRSNTSSTAAAKEPSPKKLENRPEQPSKRVTPLVAEEEKSTSAPPPNTKTEKNAAAERSVPQPSQTNVAAGNAGPSSAVDVSSSNAKRSAEPATESPRSSASNAATAFYEEGVAHLKVGRNTEAVTALKQAVYLNPEDGRAYAKLGIAYATIGQHKKALAAFKLAVRLRPDAMDTEANYRMAESYTVTGKKKEALEAYKQSLYTKRAELVENPQTTGFPTMADIHFGLGLAHYNRESFTDAIKELKQAAALEANSADIQYGLALAYLANGDRSSAQRQEKILRSLDPALANNVAAALSSATPPGITRIQPREDRRMRP
jgi:YD repeat-containing protein